MLLLHEVGRDEGGAAVFAWKWQSAGPEGPFPPAWLAFSRAVRSRAIEEFYYTAMSSWQAASGPPLFRREFYTGVSLCVGLVDFSPDLPRHEVEGVWEWQWYRALAGEQSEELEAVEGRWREALKAEGDKAYIEQDLAYKALMIHKAESAVRIARRDRDGEYAELYKRHGITSLNDLLIKCDFISLDSALRRLGITSFD